MDIYQHVQEIKTFKHRYIAPKGYKFLPDALKQCDDNAKLHFDDTTIIYYSQINFEITQDQINEILTPYLVRVTN